MSAQSSVEGVERHDAEKGRDRTGMGGRVRKARRNPLQAKVMFRGVSEDAQVEECVSGECENVVNE